MKNLQTKLEHRHLRLKRTRSKLHGTAQVPRLSIHISLRHVSAQLINDDLHHTIAYSTSIGNKKLSGNLTKKSQLIGQNIADKALKNNIKQVVFDRGYKIYHGRVKELAEAARAKGLEF